MGEENDGRRERWEKRLMEEERDERRERREKRKTRGEKDERERREERKTREERRGRRGEQKHGRGEQRKRTGEISKEKGRRVHDRLDQTMQQTQRTSQLSYLAGRICRKTRLIDAAANEKLFGRALRRSKMSAAAIETLNLGCRIHHTPANVETRLWSCIRSCLG